MKTGSINRLRVCLIEDTGVADVSQDVITGILQPADQDICLQA
jgi:hypothetical protein